MYIYGQNSFISKDIDVKVEASVNDDMSETIVAGFDAEEGAQITTNDGNIDAKVIGG